MILAQISPESIQAASDAGVGILALLALIVLGVGAWRLGDRLFATVDRLTIAAQDAQDKAEDAQKTAQAAQTALVNAGAQLTAALAENTREAKAQTAILTELRADFRAQIEESNKAITTRLDTHDEVVRAGLDELKAMLEKMRQETAEGARVQRKEYLAQFDTVLAAINRLTPPPTEPKILPKLEPLEKAA